mmetsp:Transcript_15503/g.17874  ORF Transcript_15503/g.17874 Transcript_15503/m.17874 type:complete len:92 (+) Transcript_15503:71-346(+)
MTLITEVIPLELISEMVPWKAVLVQTFYATYFSLDVGLAPYLLQSTHSQKARLLKLLPLLTLQDSIVGLTITPDLIISTIQILQILTKVCV